MEQKLIRYLYTDKNGRLLQNVVNKDVLKITADDRIRNYSDLIPDKSTLFLDPFTIVAIENVICDRKIDCFRKKLKTSEKSLTYDYNIYLSFCFALITDKQHEAIKNEKDYDLNNLEYNIRTEVMYELLKINIPCVEHFQCQSEEKKYNIITIKTSNFVSLADTIQITKYFVFAVAQSYKIEALLDDQIYHIDITVNNQRIIKKKISSSANPYESMINIVDKVFT